MLKKVDPITKLGFTQHKMQHLGSSYGGWNVPEGFLNKNSICYSAGAGEDISFDVELVKLYGCEVFIFDPTPKAVKHFEDLEKAIKKGTKIAINNNQDQFYDLDKDDLDKIHFLKLGLWNKRKKIKFFSPQNPGHASFSALNLQKTRNFIYGKVDKLSNIMKKFGHKKISLLKLDIEGAEYKVVESIAEDDLDIDLICVEFDEVNHPIDKRYKSRVQKSIKSLINKGYVIIYSDLNGTYTLMKDSFKNRSKLSKQNFLRNLRNKIFPQK